MSQYDTFYKYTGLIATFLRPASDEFANHGCNDWEFPAGWTTEEKIDFCRAYHHYNGDPENFDPNHLNIPDFAAMNFLAHMLDGKK